MLRPLGEGGKRTVVTLRRPDARRSTRPGTCRDSGSAPGCQLVQETDWYAPVRGALLVLADTAVGRAAMTGSWLAHMVWDRDRCLRGTRQPGRRRGATRPVLRGGRTRPPAPAVPVTVPRVLAGWLACREAVVSDLETSKRFRAGHIPEAAWALRADLTDPELAGRLGRPRRVVLTSSDG